MLFFHFLSVSKESLTHADKCTYKTDDKLPKGYRGELLTERLAGHSSNRQDKLGWGRETTTEVPLSRTLNPHLL